MFQLRWIVRLAKAVHLVIQLVRITSRGRGNDEEARGRAPAAFQYQAAMNAALARMSGFSAHEDTAGSRAALRQRWRALGYHRDETLGEMCRTRARLSPDAALHFVSESGSTHISLAELAERSQRLAGSLRALGLRPGDAVALQVPNWIEGALLYQAAFALGLVVVPIVHIYGAAELSYILRKSGARVLFIPDRWRRIDYLERLSMLGDAPALEHIIIIGGDAPAGMIGWSRFVAGEAAIAGAERQLADDPALLIFTSGTTADPKGVVHSHNSLLADIRTMDSVAQYPKGTALSPWPSGHIAGVLGLLRPFLTGQDAVIMDQWDAGLAARLIEQHGVVMTSGTPFHLDGLLEAAERQGNAVGSLQGYMTGAASVPPALIARAEAAGIHAYKCYGSTEHPTISSGQPADAFEKRLGTDGRILPGTQVRIVDDAGGSLPAGQAGEIAVIGPEQFLGYLDPALNTASFLPDGWFLTGDVGVVDADGFLAITDRKKDVIIRGGENIASREVEDLLARHPGILESAVVAKPDARMGEVVCAFLRIAPGAEVDLGEIGRHFRALGVARQKTPEAIRIVEDFPRTAAGKIRKHDLRDKLRREAS